MKTWLSKNKKQAKKLALTLGSKNLDKILTLDSNFVVLETCDNFTTLAEIERWIEERSKDKNTCYYEFLNLNF